MPVRPYQDEGILVELGCLRVTAHCGLERDPTIGEGMLDSGSPIRLGEAQQGESATEQVEGGYPGLQPGVRGA